MPTPSGEQTDIYLRRILAREEMASERLIAWVRIIASLSIATTYFITIESLSLLELIERAPVPQDRPLGWGPTIRGLFVMVMLAVSGLVALYLTRPARWRSWMPYAFVAADAAILVFTIVRPLIRYDLSASFAAAATAAFAVPLALAMGSLRPQPRVQLTFIGLFLGGLLVTLWWWEFSLDAPTAQEAAQTARFFDFQSNMGRLLLITAAGLTIALGVARSRLLLVRSIGEQERNQMLTRFLPSEIAPQLTHAGVRDLRSGDRRRVTIMFIDIRDSTALGETMDPLRLSIFVSSFRRRVMQAVTQYGGVVDKFVGDGALVIFGLQGGEEAAGSAIRASHLLLERVARWNAKRAFDPPIRIGIGIHTGEAFVGIVGTSERMEFTVLGDAVNIAARLEQLTKAETVPVLISADTHAAAGGPEGWALIRDVPLRGRAARLAYYCRSADQLAPPPPMKALPEPARAPDVLLPKEIHMLGHNGLVVVADGHSATLYRNTAQNGVELEAVRELNPKNLAGEGPSGSRPEEQSPRQTDEATFAKQLAEKLNAIVLQHKAEEVVIIADPQTLGQMRGSYHGELEKRIIGEIAKTLTKADADTIAKAVMNS